jgi:hypothetical protein
MLIKVKEDDVEYFSTHLLDQELTIVYADASNLAQVLPKCDIGECPK